MLDFEFKDFCGEMVVTFYLENDEETYEVARFRFSYDAFESVEAALDLWAGAVGNHFYLQTAFGYVSIRTDSYVYYDDVEGVEGCAEIENPGDFWKERLHVKLFYPEEIGVDEIYRLIDEDLDLKSFRFRMEQLFDY